MPTLPTVTVTQAQADRIVGAFGADQAEAVANYKVWLTRQVRDYVLDHTRRVLADARAASEAAEFATVLADLPPEPPLGPPA